MISRHIISGWYHLVWCILTPTMWSRFYALHVPGSVSVACSPIFTSELTVKGMGCEPLTVTLVGALLVRLWVLVLLVDKYVPSICVKLMYIWAMLLTGQVFSVGCPAGTLAYFCQWVLLHCWFTLMWRSRKMSSLLGRYDFPRCYRPIPLSLW